jgi:hypothetical protein
MVRWIDAKVKRKLAQGIVRWSRWKGQTARFLIFVGDPALSPGQGPENLRDGLGTTRR